jgi:hypothetical protein
LWELLLLLEEEGCDVASSWRASRAERSVPDCRRPYLASTVRGEDGNFRIVHDARYWNYSGKWGNYSDGKMILVNA